MTLNQLRYFITAARCHSITQAAKELFITQPAVSLAIRELEREFSLKFFAYTKNRLELTSEGEAFFERAVYLLRISDEMQMQFQDSSLYRPIVKLGIPPMLSTIFFPELMDTFHEENPDIYLELSEYGSVRACEMVQEEKLDLGLVNMEMYSIDKFSSQVLADDKLMFCVDRSHAFAGETSISLNRLDQQPLILFNRDSVQNQLLQEQFRALGIQPRIILQCSQIATTLKFLRQGKCGCFFFSSMLPYVPEVTAMSLEPEIPTRIGLVWKKGKYMSTYAERFIRFCGKFYRDNPLTETITEDT